MASNVYVAVTEPRCGKSLVSLGIMELLLRSTNKVGFFRPIIDIKTHDERDKHVDLILTHFNLQIEYEDSYAFTVEEAQGLLARGRYDELLNEVLRKYMELEARCDAVLCEGTDYESMGSAFEFDINADIARNLGCPVLLVGTAFNRTTDEVVESTRMALESFMERNCQVLGVCINRADPKGIDALSTRLRERVLTQNHLLSVIPKDDLLHAPTLEEVALHLDAEVLYGGTRLKAFQAQRCSIAAMNMSSYLSRLTDNCLVITPGDRGDIVVGCLLANRSKSYGNISGILLTAGLRPDPAVARLIEGLTSPVPILSVEANTFESVTKLNTIHSHLTADNYRKIGVALRNFETHVDVNALGDKIMTGAVSIVTPKMFEYTLVQSAKRDKQHIVLPEGKDERILRAAESLISREIADITVLGGQEEIGQLAQRLGISVEGLKIVEPERSEHFDDLVARYLEMRKHKGITAEQARDAMADVSYFGTMMVHAGLADGMVSGAAHTTQATLRPAFQIIKTKPHFTIVSSVFLMCLEDRVLVYGDCAVNPNPTAEQLAEIAVASAETGQAFGIEPRVAMLSYSSGASGKGDEVEKVRAATQMAKRRRPDILIEGPIQYDAAVDADVGQRKMPGSEVAGRATVLVFPDLNTGNNTYKAVQRETNAIAIGPVLQGLNKPVNDLSRGCTVPDVVNTIVITAIQAQHAKGMS